MFHRDFGLGFRQGRRCRWLALVGTGVIVTLGSVAPRLSAADWHQETGYRWAPLKVEQSGGAAVGFARLDPGLTGLQFTNVLSEEAGAANRILYNGAGIAAGDVDGDGLPDLFLCDLSGTNRLFRNLGDWRFEDATDRAGLGAPLPATRGAVFADLNGDRHLDLLLSVNGGGVRCYLNDGQGRFSDVTDAAGTASSYGSTTLALADIDGNGTLDLYIANYRADDIRDRGRVRMRMVNGRPILPGAETNRFILLNGRLEECGQPDQLLLNDGKARFREVSWTGGAFRDEDGRPLAEPPLDWGLTATFRDVNRDGAPDLYVCNDYWTPDRFWINDGRGGFRAVPRLALRKTSASSMSADFADLDGDGDLDLFVVDMLSRYPAMRKRQAMAQRPAVTPPGVIDDRPQVMRNTLYFNRGDGTFAEVAYYAGIPASDWSWSPIFSDVDLDGYPDLIIGAGHFRDVQDYDAEREVQARQRSWNGFPTEAARQRAFTRELLEHYRLYPLLQMPIGGFRNQGNGVFQEVTANWGLDHAGVHQGLALADLDGDGDLDLAVNCLNGPAELYRQTTAANRVAVRLRGQPPNTQGIGAGVTLRGGPAPEQSSEVICGGRYQSGSEAQVVFATGAARDGLALEVRWRSGRSTVLADIRPNRLYEVDEPVAAPAVGASRPPVPGRPYFEPVAKVSVRHPEADFPDFDRQPLLPYKLSQLGPGVAWADLNGDGHEDLVLGSGRGGMPTALLGDGQGEFTPVDASAFPPLPDDSSGVVAWMGTQGTARVLAGLTGYEAAVNPAIQEWQITHGKWVSGPASMPGLTGAGALALSDPSGDGRLALFVAGGVRAGAYPVGTPSRLFRWEGRQWLADARQNVLLENLGIVNGAVWSDLDGDGNAELVLACEWGPIRVFAQRGGAFLERTAELGLQSYTGWWRGITTGDLNGDGRLDIIAANWGANSPYRASPERPLTFVYGQLAQPGVTDVLETEYVGASLAPRRQFMALAQSLPFLMAQFPTQRAYSEATLDEVLGERKALSRRVTATTLASTVFLNTGQGFQAVPLPAEAQFAPAFSVQVADFDGDGHEDVFLSQNLFAIEPETTRIDAGVGLWLKGDGSGRLSSVPVTVSGIHVYGEQRGAAVADFDEDGRPDLAISQNGAELKLYRNAGASPGLRVRLRGTPGNPAGLGAVLQLQFAGGTYGPAREIHGGSGHWSQDSVVQVLSVPRSAVGLRVRWPGGRTTETPVPSGTHEITVDVAGQIVARR